MKYFKKCPAYAKGILKKKTPMKSERGFTLIETLIAIAVLGLIAVAFFTGLATASKVLFITDQRQTAQALAQSQLEYVKGIPGLLPGYNPAPVPDEFTDAGYSVAIICDGITSRDENIQMVRIVVSHYGTPIILTGNSTLEGYKVRR